MTTNSMSRASRTTLIMGLALCVGGAVAVQGCSSASETTSKGSSAIDPGTSSGDVIPSTTYSFTINQIDAVKARVDKSIDGTGPSDDYGSNPDDDQFSEYAGLGAYVKSADPSAVAVPPSFVGCGLGMAVSGTTLANCLDKGTNAFQQGKPISQTVQVTNLNDQVNLVITLDNIEGGSAAAMNGDALAWGVSGNMVQAVGAVGAGATSVIGATATGETAAAVTAQAAAAGGVFAIIGVAGIGMSVYANLIAGHTYSHVPFCAGGLIGLPNPVPQVGWTGTPQTWQPAAPSFPPPALDALYKTFTPAELDAITADGPHEFVFPVAVTYPYGLYAANWSLDECDSQHNIHLTVARVSPTGRAASAKSADATVVAPNGVETFSVNANYGTIQRATRAADGTWSTQLVDVSPAPVLRNATTPIAAVSNSADGREDVFFADDTGAVFWNSWTTSNGVHNGYWTTTLIGQAVPNARIAAVSRKPDSVDVFWADGSNVLQHVMIHFYRSWWINLPLEVSTPGGFVGVSAPAGAGIAAVARTSSLIDVFYVGGADSSVHDVQLSFPGPNAQGVDLPSTQQWEVPSTAGVAPAGGDITAVARTANNLDVFYIGNDRGLWTSSWVTGAPSFVTNEIDKGAAFAAGESISAVARQPYNMDVIYSSGKTLLQSSWSNTCTTWACAVSSTSPALWTTSTLESSVQPSALYNVSLVAPTSWSLESSFEVPFGALPYATTWSYGNAPSSPVSLPYPAAAGGPLTRTFTNERLVVQGKCIDLPNWDTADGTPLEIFDCKGTNDSNQRWTMGQDGLIRSAVDETKCIDLPNWSSANGVTLQIYTCNFGTNQTWKYGADNTIRGYAAKCIDLANLVTTNGNAIDYWPCNGGINQQMVATP